MPITLEKLLSPTAVVAFPFMGDMVNVTYAPMRYTGEMQELAERLTDEETAEQAAIAELRTQAAAIVAEATTKAEKLAAQVDAAKLEAEATNREVRLALRDKRRLRDFLATLLVSWDVLEGKKPLGTDRQTLDKLPDVFLRVVFVSLAQENQPDPPKAPSSDEP